MFYERRTYLDMQHVLTLLAGVMAVGHHRPGLLRLHPINALLAEPEPDARLVLHVLLHRQHEERAGRRLRLALKDPAHVVDEACRRHHRQPGLVEQQLCTRVVEKKKMLADASILRGLLVELLCHKVIASGCTQDRAYLMQLHGVLQDEKRVLFAMPLMQCDLLAVIRGRCDRGLTRRWIAQLIGTGSSGMPNAMYGRFESGWPPMMPRSMPVRPKSISTSSPIPFSPADGPIPYPPGPVLIPRATATAERTQGLRARPSRRAGRRRRGNGEAVGACANSDPADEDEDRDEVTLVGPPRLRAKRLNAPIQVLPPRDSHLPGKAFHARRRNEVARHILPPAHPEARPPPRVQHLRPQGMLRSTAFPLPT
ncbi:hypothetical protein NUW54_g13070 [Trametes sanguinea]|uniref:Uncharacterized protein n=1 Tax=Trametes sanguinea TaxID=158606 RepID=A0ACC1MRU9_9APHY|nr:hypothetical protein NUW54_g13070 [Trametes sanguinea]